MGLQETILEVIEELGVADELVNMEHQVILKVKQGCANKRLLPKDISLSGDAKRLSMSEQAFVSNRSFLENMRYSAALFAGCSEFSSSDAFLETTKHVLKNVRSLVLLHNRNKVFNLVTWFAKAHTIVLYHNLRYHADTGVAYNTLPFSRLEQLLGTMPALGLDHLCLSSDTLQSLFRKCPKLTSVMSSDMETALSAKQVTNFIPNKLTRKRQPVPIQRKELFLGRTYILHTGMPLEFISKNATAVEKAHRHFPKAEHLELTAACEGAIAKVARYTKLTHLSLFSAMPREKSLFQPHVTQVLSALRLVHLSLAHFCGVGLSVIAELCPQLKFLSIRACDISDEEDMVTSFSNLEHMCVGSTMKKEFFFKLLRSCPGLRELEIDKDELTTAFVVGPDASCGKRPILERVERLTLRTNTDWSEFCGLDHVDDLPRNLDSTLSRLPSLRRVRTDSFKIRLHINCCFPNIVLDWCTCTICDSKFPDIDQQHRDLYQLTHRLKQPKLTENATATAVDKNKVKLKRKSVDTKKEVPKEEVAVSTKGTKLKLEQTAVNIKNKKRIQTVRSTVNRRKSKRAL
ncbi:uncharacterized protein LOC142764968 [Rhipicephalus microplus]|uniref:uncharacterized protein LOC142764968 n=1 Tax=Rhipicephalus microplus TaxID=6941 RepID=UPI003F6B0528